jgi:hypothetical protein
MEFNDQSRLHRFLATWLIRLKFIKQIPADLDLVNQDLASELPISFAISIPGGSGDLTLTDVQVSIDEVTNTILADLLCDFVVTVAGTIIYQAYIQIILEGNVTYDQETKIIKPVNVRVRSTELIATKRSMIKDTRSLIVDRLPEPIKTVFISSFITTDAILKTIGVNELVKYLSLYLSGSKQRILDYHHVDIENTILNYIETGHLTYQLDESIFEEQLFADYGQEIAVNNGQLLYIFHPSQS